MPGFVVCGRGRPVRETLLVTGGRCRSSTAPVVFRLGPVVAAVALVVATLIAVASPASATTLSFAPAANFTADNQPISVAFGDFNGDGKADLAVANHASHDVSVLLNTTAAGATIPTYAPAMNFAAGPSPFSVAVADFNGDGKADLAVANNSNSGIVSVLLNTTATGATTPTFAPAMNFAAGSGPLSVAVGDFNGDGQADLAVANSNSDDVLVLLNTTATGATTPTFSPAMNFITGTAPTSVAVGDVNGDGKADLAVANSGSGDVSVLLNTTATGATTPTFAPAQSFAAGTAPRSVAVGDINGDGQADLAVANIGTGDVSVLLNTTATGATTPTFAPAVNFTTDNSPESVAMGDFNGDGQSDLAVANIGTGDVSVLLNTTATGATTPTFAPAVNFTVGHEPFSVAVGDVNGDGKADLAVANVFPSDVSVLLNQTIFHATLTGRAFGLSLAGLLDVPPTPDTGPVATTSASTTSTPCVATLGALGALAAQVLCAKVTTAMGPPTSMATASVAATNLGVPLVPVIKIGAAQSSSTTSCTGSSGSSTVASLAVGGVVVISSPTSVKPNTTFNLGVVEIVLNEQVPITGTDKGLTVNAVHIIVPGLVNLIVASSSSDIRNCP